MQPESNLLEVQRRLLSALREPIFGESRSRTELGPRTGAVSEAFVTTAEELIASSPTLAPVERLELYHRQYWYRLLDSIAEDFPALRLLVGDETFWNLMEAYLEAVPATSFTLRHLGRSLARFIAEQPDLLPHPVYAHDMARLEYAVMEAFEAAEHVPIPPSKLAGSCIALQPHVHLLELRTPADKIWRDAGKGRPLGQLHPPSDRSARFVAVFRRDFEIEVETMPWPAYSILSAVSKTASLAETMELVVRDERLAEEADPARVSEWFNTWVRRGWFVPKEAIAVDTRS